jgi:hypothetical protein
VHTLRKVGQLGSNPFRLTHFILSELENKSASFRVTIPLITINPISRFAYTPQTKLINSKIQKPPACYMTALCCPKRSMNGELPTHSFMPKEEQYPKQILDCDSGVVRLVLLMSITIVD